MAMNNNFKELAETFANQNEHLVMDWTDEELDSNIRMFIDAQGIDPAWEDEACEVVREHLSNLWD